METTSSLETSEYNSVTYSLMQPTNQQEIKYSAARRPNIQMELEIKLV